jgi:signal transduction histidine kinase
MHSPNEVQAEVADVIAPGRTTERRIDGAPQGQIDELVTAAGTWVKRLTGGSAAAPVRVVRGREAEVTGGLTRRMVVVSGLLALIIGTGFAVLLVSVADLRTTERRARHSEQVLAAANQLERLVIDLETGQRGFAITSQEHFLQPWRAAQIAVPGQASTLQRLVIGNPVQQRRAQRITQAVTSYVRDYSVPLVAAAWHDPDSARTVAATQEGKRRVDAMRLEFDRLIGTEQGMAVVRQERSDAAAGRAIGAAVGGLAGSVLLIMGFAEYLTRAIVRPVRGAAAMAGRLAGGDLGARLPERGVGEIGVLERSFNTMAGSLAASRGELGRLADEQAALRRVATLVARGVPAAEVFAAVAEEAGRLLGTDSAHLARYEHDGTATLVAGWSRDGDPPLVGTRYPIEEGTLSALMLRTGRPARIDNYTDAPGPIGARIRQLGIQSSVACPITVQGRPWGQTSVSSTRPEPLPAGTEARIADFTELAATAIANTQARAELAASRARIVAAADQTRRRIERDLHDGIQQRLVSLGLDLRAAQATVPAKSPELRTQLARVADGLGEALEELQELSRGIHPAILSQGGLGPALKALVRRSAVPVEADLKIETRLPEPVEAAAYYVVAEALTNAAKHAHAAVAHVDVRARDGRLHLSVRDDGVGGADLARGSGLIGLSDRVQALGGTITVRSPISEGTTLQVDLPIDLKEN